MAEKLKKTASSGKAKTEKSTVVDKEVKKTAKKAEKYFYGVGRRKSSVAQVRIYKKEKATDADIIVNDKKLKEYFPIESLQETVLSPLKDAGVYESFRVTIVVKGGGFNGQSQAIRLGIARALVVSDEALKKTLRSNGHLTRDARKVERKKPGLKKARKAPQWSKR